MHSNAVLMVPGLAETSAMMRPLASVLRLSGHNPVLFDYPSTSATIEALTHSYLGPAIMRLAGKERVDIVTHSMGGIMLRYYLLNHSLPNLGRVVMYAPGHAGSPMMSLFSCNPLWRFLMGPAGVQSGADENGFALQIPRRIDAEVGVIAGCMPLDPTSLSLMPWPHDGRLPVASTTIDGMSDQIMLPCSHDLMMLNPLAWYEGLHFLEHGKFDHGPFRRSQ